VAYYVDTCIYLNLWQKEESNSGLPFWKYAKDFFEKCEKEGKNFFYSGFVLKELNFVLGEKEFAGKRHLFSQPFFKKVIAYEEDYDKARRIESESFFEVSFFDCMHVVLANKSSSILVTRDRKLIELAEKYCTVARPEELL